VDYYDLKNTETFLISQKAFILKRDKLLLLEYPKKDGKIWEGKWCLPGGLLEMNEKIEDGLTREIKEETGLEVSNIQIFGVADVKYPGFIFKDGRKLNIRFIEIGYTCKHVRGKLKLSDEHTGYKWVTKEELHNLEIAPDSKELIKNYQAKSRASKRKLATEPN
jgi:8-oxo-dGTP diphosphatase